MTASSPGERRARPHLGGLRPRPRDVVERFSSAVRTGGSSSTPDGGRRLGGIYNSMTPTFSLGCGQLRGGLNTTDNINYRNLLNIKTASHRQAPPQWFRVPSDTYFNAGAIENLRGVSVEKILLVTDADSRVPRPGDAASAPRGRLFIHSPIFTRSRPRSRSGRASMRSPSSSPRRSSPPAAARSSTLRRQCGSSTRVPS